MRHRLILGSFVMLSILAGCGGAPTGDAGDTSSAISSPGESGSRKVADSAAGAVVLADATINGAEKLVMAWTGTNGSQNLNVATWSDDLKTYSTVTGSGRSSAAPGLAYGDGNLYLAWAGTDLYHSVNVESSPDAENFSTTLTFPSHPEMTYAYARGYDSISAVAAAPSVAYFDGKVYVAWREGEVYGYYTQTYTTVSYDSNGNPVYSYSTTNYTDQLNPQASLLKILVIDPATGASADRVFGERSGYDPHLAVVDGALDLLWNGTDKNHSINIGRSTDGVSFAKQTLSISASVAPSLLGLAGGDGLLVWAGTDKNRSLNSSILDNGAWTKTDTFGDRTNDPPALVSYKGTPVMGWPGTDGGHHINLTTLPVTP